MNLSFGFVDISATFDRADIRKNRILCIFAYIPFLFFIPVLFAGKSPVSKFHANQGLVISGISLFSWLLYRIFWLLSPAASVFSFIAILLDIYGIYCVIKEKAVEFPLVSSICVFK
jgi:uncharacterized membrane protein